MTKAIKLKLLTMLSAGMLLVSCNGNSNSDSTQTPADTANIIKDQGDASIPDTAKNDTTQTNSENTPGPAVEAEANVHPPH